MAGKGGRPKGSAGKPKTAKMLVELDRLIWRILKQGGLPVLGQDGRAVLAEDGEPVIHGMSAALLREVRARIREAQELERAAGPLNGRDDDPSSPGWFTREAERRGMTAAVLAAEAEKRINEGRLKFKGRTIVPADEPHGMTPSPHAVTGPVAGGPQVLENPDE